MFIEDLISRLANSGSFMFNDPITLFPMDSQVIASLSNQICQGNGFTEKQSTLSVKLCKKYSRVLSVAFNKDVRPFVENPEFKLPFRILSTSKTVNIEKIELANKKVIRLNFPYNETLIESIKIYKKTLSHTDPLYNGINWNGDNKSWDFDLREEHINWIGLNVLPLGFNADNDFLDYFKQINEVQNNLENYIPMVVFEDGIFKYKNASNKIPQPTSTSVIDVLIDAKKYGITTWSEDIAEAISHLDLNKHLKKFLSSPTFEINRDDINLGELIDIATYNMPCLIVIPGGSELKHMSLCMKVLKNHGIQEEDVSVLFRLDNATGKACNDYVRDSKINNTLTEKTKVIFISGKVPKPLVESKINFISILNLGISGVHYTLSNYLRNHHFVINYTIKEDDFVNV
jgi:hypothetical protein